MSSLKLIKGLSQVLVSNPRIPEPFYATGLVTTATDEAIAFLGQPGTTQCCGAKHFLMQRFYNRTFDDLLLQYGNSINMFFLGMPMNYTTYIMDKKGGHRYMPGTSREPMVETVEKGITMTLDELNLRKKGVVEFIYEKIDLYTFMIFIKPVTMEWRS